MTEQSPPERGAPGTVGLVVLDWAGTTVDFGCFAPAVTFQDVFRQNGVEITIDIHQSQKLLDDISDIAVDGGACHGVHGVRLTGIEEQLHLKCLQLAV